MKVFECAGKRCRMTQQRQAVLNAPTHANAVLDVEWVYREARREAPNITLATVARTLNLLWLASLQDQAPRVLVSSGPIRPEMRVALRIDHAVRCPACAATESRTSSKVSARVCWNRPCPPVLSWPWASSYSYQGSAPTVSANTRRRERCDEPSIEPFAPRARQEPRSPKAAGALSCLGVGLAYSVNCRTVASSRRMTSLLIRLNAES